MSKSDDRMKLEVAGLAGIFANLLNVFGRKTQGWGVVVYERGEVREE